MDLSPIGYFSKTHGVKGQLILKTEKDFDVDALKALFIETATGKAPYFVTEVKEAGANLVLELEEVPNVEKARMLIGKQVYIDASLIEEEESDDAWIGFELIDAHHGSLGQVSAVSDNGQQMLLSLQHKGKEIILPMVEEFIEKIDEENKKIFFQAPEGLIELYLSED